MPFKKRKVEFEVKEEASSPRGNGDAEVKVERLSQDESGGDQQMEGKSANVRNLRPRKSTCYVEKDSPEIDCEEKHKRIPRRKRRQLASEEGPDEKDSKIKRTEKEVDVLPSSENIDLPVPTLVSCSDLNENSTEKQPGSQKDAGADPEGQPKEKKRPKRKPRPKPKLTPADNLPLDPDVVPKTEPLSPPAAKNSENGDDTVESKPLAEKPKPKKQIRNRKPATANSGGNGKQVIKQEEGNDPSAAPKKKPVKKKARPQVKKEPLEDDASKIPNDDDESAGGGEKAIKAEGENEAEKGTIQKPAAKKRNRPKKPAISIKTTTTDNADESNAEGKTKTEDGGGESKKVDGESANTEPVVKVQVPATRKPFFRGRRSKSVSARSGRKEIIHTEEAIDPEDIRGFEHVEKYVTPPGVRLPKFWDSEDEMSEDENSDNFRRIMCGFGTNCRIHEVIRPASEIVRRLKELQNTFGATKSLPLFRKDELDLNEDTSVSSGTESFSRKERERTITWHTDPSFFKYANNYPSKCK